MVWSAVGHPFPARVHRQPFAGDRTGEEEQAMRELLAWMVEQACRLADDQVCAMANLTDDLETSEVYAPEF